MLPGLGVGMDDLVEASGLLIFVAGAAAAVGGLAAPMLAEQISERRLLAGLLVASSIALVLLGTHAILLGVRRAARGAVPRDRAVLPPDGRAGRAARRCRRHRDHQRRARGVGLPRPAGRDQPAGHRLAGAPLRCARGSGHRDRAAVPSAGRTGSLPDSSGPMGRSARAGPSPRGFRAHPARGASARTRAAPPRAGPPGGRAWPRRRTGPRAGWPRAGPRAPRPSGSIMAGWPGDVEPHGEGREVEDAARVLVEVVQHHVDPAELDAPGGPGRGSRARRGARERRPSGGRAGGRSGWPARSRRR